MKFKIFLVLVIEVVSWVYPLLLISIASVLVTLSMSYFFSEMASLSFLMLLPAFYLAWLSTLITLNAISVRIQSWFFSKPKSLEVNPLDMPLQLLQFTLIINSYKIMSLIETLPLIKYLQLVPGSLAWIRNCIMMAYAPKVHIGKRSVVIPLLQDPDLTYIGDNAVIGSNCEIVAHAVNADKGKLKYASEPIIIGNRATIGGNSLIGMGVKIGEAAIVEAGSNVQPYSRIDSGEVWGGNPAVFLRYRSGFKQQVDVYGQVNSTELNKIIANALRLPLEQITDDFSSDNCMEWDSLSNMVIAAALYDRFSLRIPDEKIIQLNSRHSIEQVIASLDHNPISDHQKLLQPQMSHNL